MPETKPARDTLSLDDEAPPPEPNARRMEVVSGLLRLGGDVMNEVPIQGPTAITAAEAVFLRKLHGGPEALYNLKVVGTVPYEAGRERQRILKKYPREDHARLLDLLFPGVRPDFPTTLREVDEIAALEMQAGEEAVTDEEPVATSLASQMTPVAAN